MALRPFAFKLVLFALLGVSRLAFANCSGQLANSTEARLAYFESRFSAEFRERLLRVARRLTHNHHDAEEVLQEGLIRAWKHIDYLMAEPDLVLFRWMRTVLRNVWFSRWKQQSRMISLEEQNGARLADLQAPAHERREEITDAVLRSDWESVKGYLGPDDPLITALDRLNPGRREIFLLRYLLNLRPSEISRCLGMRVCTVDANIYRAAILLRNRLRFE